MTDQPSPEAYVQEVWARLAGGVAFELRAALNVVRNHAELSLEELGPHHPVAAHIAEIQKAVDRASQATDLLGNQNRTTSDKARAPQS